MKRMSRCLNSILLLLIVVGATGCSTTSMLVSYPSQTKTVKQAICDGELDPSYEKLGKNAEKSADRILYLQERGRVADLKNDSEASIKDYTAAAELIEENRQKALVSLSELGGNTASLFTNDNAIPYAGHGYEKIFLHTYNALSFLELNEKESALVEVRKANSEQNYALALHQKELEKTREIAKNNKVNLGSDNASIKKAYDAMANEVGSVKDSFQNAFTYYLSGVLYESQGETEDGYIDYKKALEIYPDNSFMRDAVLRLAKELGRDEELEYYVKAYSIDVAPAVNPFKKRVLVIYEEGFVPEKQSFGVPLFLGGKSYTINMPYYDSHGGPAYSLHVDCDGKHIANTELACSVGAMAVKSLLEDYTAIFIRQAARLMVKHELQEKTGGKNPYVGAFVAIASIVTERADRRSWLTLPSNVQIADILIDEKANELELTTSLGQRAIIPTEDLQPPISIVRVINTGGKLYTKVLNT